MNPDRVLAILALSATVDLYQLPEKIASAYTSRDLILFGVRITHLSFVLRRYLTMCSIALKVVILEFLQNLTH